MTLWFIFAMMTAAAMFAVLWPLGRGPRVGRGGSDLVVYKDQLQEIDRDRAAGLIGEAEAEAARLEISRRLLAAADAEKTRAAVSKAAAKRVSARLTSARLTWRRLAIVAVLVVLPLGPASLYVALGSPNIPVQSAFARVNGPQGDNIADLVGKVEAHLAQNPGDGRGWELLAPVYMRLGRFDDAVAARRKALALNGETAARHADLGESLTVAANGVVTAEAKTEFDRAVVLDAKDPKARYFVGLAAEQDGNKAAAASIWRALLDDAPPGAPYIKLVREALARATGTAPQASPSDDEMAAPAPGPTTQDVAAAAQMSDEGRRDMIRGMVSRLADRLHQDGGDVDAWLRLVRAYAVLGERDKAKDAAADARRALADRPDGIRLIDDLVKGLGLEG
jgi:cytochrome c-type biogenesis protein CcmH